MEIKWVVIAIQLIIAAIIAILGLSAMGVISLGFLPESTLWLTGLIGVIAAGIIVFTSFVHIE
jgi:hypothetical protein